MDPCLRLRRGPPQGVFALLCEREVLVGVICTTPEEVATLVVLLASKRTANVTGANYVIDGGLLKTT